MTKIETQEIQITDIGNNTMFYLPKDKDWNFKINSCGGSLTSSIYLIEQMLKHKNKVTTECLGNCQSAAFLIFAAGQERISYKYGVFMFHSGNMSNPPPLNAMEDYIKKYKIHQEFALRLLAKASNKSYKYWNDLHKTDKDYFFTAAELKKMGIVTKLV